MAASFINGMTYLQNTYSSVYGGTSIVNGSTTSPTQAMSSFAVGWTSPGGVVRIGYYNSASVGDQTWWQSMIYWTQDYAPHISTSYAGEDWSTFSTASSWLDAGAVKTSYAPDLSFLSTLSAAGDYVEMGVYDVTTTSSKYGEGHAINLLGLSGSTIYFQDPNNPTVLYSSTVQYSNNAGQTYYVPGVDPLVFTVPYTFGTDSVVLAASYSVLPGVYIPEPAAIVLMLSLLGLVLVRDARMGARLTF